MTLLAARRRERDPTRGRAGRGKPGEERSAARSAPQEAAELAELPPYLAEAVALTDFDYAPSAGDTDSRLELAGLEDRVEEARAYLARGLPFSVKTSLTLGSGLGSVRDAIRPGPLV